GIFFKILNLLMTIFMLSLSKITFMNVLLGIVVFFFTGCQIDETTKKAKAIVDKPPRKTIPYKLLALNAFFNDPRFGSLYYQVTDVLRNLKLNRLRVLIRWDDKAHPSPEMRPNFALLEEILNSLPQDAKVLIVTTGTPTWMSDSSNWLSENPRKTFIELWFKPLIQFLFTRTQVEAIQIWNEPNDMDQVENRIMAFKDSGKYFELLKACSEFLKSSGQQIRILNGATTAINQGGHGALNYNKELVKLGAHHLVDAWAIHFYGMQFERVFKNGGVADVLKRVKKPLWITESGARGINNQLEYGERVWPFLAENFEFLARIYIYTYTEDAPSDQTYGLRNLSTRPYSDLYLHLLERVK
ncbi:MAG: glycoside hydrolase family 5 protein, partial [Deltaproteobacteria bacterium]|nr:glycoside hydrolase family 5 protein [Deltaproteobacteria bacterium]